MATNINIRLEFLSAAGDSLQFADSVGHERNSSDQGKENLAREMFAELRKLVNDEEHGGCLVPMILLCHEHDEDPEMRPEPISPEKREEVIAHMAAGFVEAYEYFREHRENYAGTTFTSESRGNAPKVGRNDPCPCGSGKKYKRCCGSVTIN
jgi:uncharacterized protein YecA (UPF0149 family)